MVEARKLRTGRQIGGRAYRGWKDWSEGDYIIAKFLAEYEDNYEKPGYEMEIIECEFEKESSIWKPGTIVGLNSSGSLNHKMKEIEVGDIVKIEYGGKDVLQKGKYKDKDFHVVNLWLMEESQDEIPDPKANAAKRSLL